MQPELAMGAVVDGEQPIIVRNQDVIELTGVSEPTFDAVCKKELAEIERRRERYLGSRARSAVEGQVVIIVDDGIATGATTLAAIRALRKREPKELVLAVPVAPFGQIPQAGVISHQAAAGTAGRPRRAPWRAYCRNSNWRPSARI